MFQDNFPTDFSKSGDALLSTDSHSSTDKKHLESQTSEGRDRDEGGQRTSSTIPGSKTEEEMAPDIKTEEERISGVAQGIKTEHEKRRAMSSTVPACSKIGDERRRKRSGTAPDSKTEDERKRKLSSTIPDSKTEDKRRRISSTAPDAEDGGRELLWTEEHLQSASL